MSGQDYVALALDRQGNQCDVISSNPGHLLSTGILTKAQEQSVAFKLMRPDMFSGWGIRTLSSQELAYNPNPVSCVPQAWAAGAMIGMLAACLGLRADTNENRLAIKHPRLPSWLGRVRISRLRLSNSCLDLEFSSSDRSTICRVADKDGDLQIRIDD